MIGFWFFILILCMYWPIWLAFICIAYEHFKPKDSEHEKFLRDLKQKGISTIIRADGETVCGYCWLTTKHHTKCIYYGKS